ncbi:hypothetical protein AMECASPLE_036774 [Ameca splendens]|uniref:Uncharacterized protein n=1 Tax=Ameca splendens TaxID=208324 RepID=A0ABV0Y7K6_9TELE
MELESISSWSLSPAAIGRAVRSSLDRSPVHHWTTQRYTGQTTIHTLIPTGNLERPINSHVLGLWEDVAVPREDPGMHGENIQPSCRRPPAGSRGPSCCKTTAPPVAPPFTLCECSAAVRV